MKSMTDNKNFTIGLRHYITYKKKENKLICTFCSPPLKASLFLGSLIITGSICSWLVEKNHKNIVIYSTFFTGLLIGIAGLLYRRIIIFDMAIKTVTLTRSFCLFSFMPHVINRAPILKLGLKQGYYDSGDSGGIGPHVTLYCIDQFGVSYHIQKIWDCLRDKKELIDFVRAISEELKIEFIEEGPTSEYEKRLEAQLTAGQIFSRYYLDNFKDTFKRLYDKFKRK